MNIVIHGLIPSNHIVFWHGISFWYGIVRNATSNLLSRSDMRQAYRFPYRVYFSVSQRYKYIFIYQNIKQYIFFYIYCFLLYIVKILINIGVITIISIYRYSSINKQIIKHNFKFKFKHIEQSDCLWCKKKCLATHVERHRPFFTNAIYYNSLRIN